MYRRPSQIKLNRGQVFCGLNCYGISQRKENPCVVCGTMILGGLHKKTCGRSCANTHRAGIKYKIGRPKDKAKYQLGLKIRLIEARGAKCERCEYGKPEILQVHYKDRDRNNSELNNLELVCPNCHCEEHYLEKSLVRGKFSNVDKEAKNAIVV